MQYASWPCSLPSDQVAHYCCSHSSHLWPFAQKYRDCAANKHKLSCMLHLTIPMTPHHMSTIPALPIWTANLVSFPWRTDFSFLCMFAFLLSLSSPSPPSALFSGCISIAAAPSCCLAISTERKLLIKTLAQRHF